MTIRTSIADSSLDEARESLRVALPDEGSTLSQDQESFLVEIGEEWTEMRIHDYPEIFGIQGLYERIVYDLLQCQSPEVVVALLTSEVSKAGDKPAELSVLDLGAGNGYVAEILAGKGFDRFVGLDLLPQAAEAAERDRPGLYEEFVVGDITDLPETESAKIRGKEFDCLTCVAALGFGDIPPEAFLAAFDYIREGGWLAFNINSRFLEPGEKSGFSKLIRTMIDRGVIEQLAFERYTHRLATSGDPIEYAALIGRKLTAAPDDLWPRG